MGLTISVVIPVYNVEEYLFECLDSVLNQTIPFDEIIIVNDGSTDASGEICHSFQLTNTKIKIIEQENLGLSIARNAGAEVASGDYIVFLDSDDLVSRKMCETIKMILENNHTMDVLYYAAKVRNDIEDIRHDNIYKRNEKMCNSIMTGIEFFNRSFPLEYVVSSCMAAYRKDFLKIYDIKFPEGLYYEDEYFQIQVVFNAKKIECITDQLYIRRYRAGSIMNSTIKEKHCIDSMCIQVKIWDYIKERQLIVRNVECLINYILVGVTNVLFKLEQYKFRESLIDNEVSFFKTFLEYWEELCIKNALSLSNCCTLLKVYGELGKKDNDIYLQKYENIRKQAKTKLIHKLDKLCLNNPNVKVGIYGMGKHTVAMLALYEKYITEIRCNYIYVVTNLNQEYSQQESKGHSIVSYKNIPDDIDYFIISSFIYMNDMYENLVSVKISPERIRKLYKENEVGDLVMVYEIMKD